MKKAILIFGFLIFTTALSAQCSASLRLGSTDASTLSPGDQVYVPVYCDDIDNLVTGFIFNIYYDHEVLSWNGSETDPLPGVEYFHPNLPYNIGNWIFIDDESTILTNWIDPTFNGVQINPGEIFLVYSFTYLGGETQLLWDSNSEMCETMTLIDGCVCSSVPYPVVFHVTSNGNDLEGAWVTLGPVSLPTDASGIAIFSLPNGDYTYTITKESFADSEGSFTVAGAPQLIEVEMEVCYDVTFHITGCDSAVININGEVLYPNANGNATICLADGSYYFYVSCSGYIPYGGQIVVMGSNMTVNIDLFPLLYEVTFFINCCGEPIENYPITYGTQTVMTNTAGLAMLNLPAGIYSFEIGGVPITFTVPDTVYVPVDICSEVTFLLTCQGAPLAGALVTVDSFFQQFTNANGIAFFCLQNGLHQYEITKPGYETITGEFNVNNEPLLIENDPCFYWPEVTLFVNCCGEPLEGIPVTIDGYTIITPVSGVVVLSLLPGSYSVAIGSYIFNFTVPGTTYIDADICSEVTFQVKDEIGQPLEGVSIEVNGEYLLTDISGMAFICLEVGSYNYSASKPGFVTQTGSFEMDTIPQTVEIVMPAQTWGVIINVIGFECDNEFEELIIICNGDTVSVGQPVYLENGSYNFEVAILGCPSLVTGNFEVVNAPQTVELILNDFPKAYIHVSWAGYPVSNVAVVLDNEDTLYTNGSGNAIFCVGGGNHIVHIPEYGFYEGEFTFNCFENIHYYYLGGIGIKEISLENIFQLYPNPSSGKFYFEAKNTGSDPIELQVMDLTGRIVYERQPAISEKFEIDLSGQPKGMYFVRVKSGEGLFTEKIVIQ